MNRWKRMLLLLAVLSVCGAIPAAAQGAYFKASSYPTTVTGETAAKNESFVLDHNGFFFECKSHFSGTLPSAVTALEVEVTLTQCFVGIAAVLSQMNGCKFRLHVKSGSVDVVCPPGKFMEFRVPAVASCSFAVPPQTGITKASYSNSSPLDDISVEMAVTNLTYDVIKTQLGCPLGSSIGRYSSGTWSQESPVTLEGTAGQTVYIG